MYPKRKVVSEEVEIKEASCQENFQKLTKKVIAFIGEGPVRVLSWWETITSRFY